VREQPWVRVLSGYGAGEFVSSWRGVVPKVALTLFFHFFFLLFGGQTDGPTNIAGLQYIR